MTQRFYTFLICAFLLTGIIIPQDKLADVSDKIPEITNSNRQTLLWDNMLPISTTGIVSSLYGGLTPPDNIVQCAEDFTVPAGTTWDITEILFTGFLSAGSADPANYAIDFFENSGGAPGNLITSRTISNPGFDPVTGTFSAVTLGPGTYWVSVYGTHPTAATIAAFRWNWYASATPNMIGSEPYIRDLSGLFGGLPWSTFSSLALAFGGLLFELHGTEVVPVELTSFSASVTGSQVTLNWQTASETNNYGFEVQRSNDNENFITVGFVNGFGTTTESQNYSYSDKNLTNGTYVYRLKQVDYDGKFEFSNEIEVDFESVPSDFALSQNFPNPFNPSTRISFALPVDANVTIKLFNIVGEEVSSLVTGTYTAGTHNIDFNAAGLNSGVYFYSIEAIGIDGKMFSEAKKMMLTK